MSREECQERMSQQERQKVIDILRQLAYLQKQLKQLLDS